MNSLSFVAAAFFYWRLPPRSIVVKKTIAHGSLLIFERPWLSGQNGDDPVSSRCGSEWVEDRMYEIGNCLFAIRE